VVYPEAERGHVLNREVAFIISIFSSCCHRSQSCTVHAPLAGCNAVGRLSVAIALSRCDNCVRMRAPRLQSPDGNEPNWTSAFLSLHNSWHLYGKCFPFIPFSISDRLRDVDCMTPAKIWHWSVFFTAIYYTFIQVPIIQHWSLECRLHKCSSDWTGYWIYDSSSAAGGNAECFALTVMMLWNLLQFAELVLNWMPFLHPASSEYLSTLWLIAQCGRVLQCN